MESAIENIFSKKLETNGSDIEADAISASSLGNELPIDTYAPAANRIVRRSDNEDTWANAAEGVVALRDAMTEANDHGELGDDEFEQKLSEVRALEIMLNSPQVQWEVLDQFATKTVKYLAMKFADKAIGLAATGLIVYLTTLLQGML